MSPSYERIIETLSFIACKEKIKEIESTSHKLSEETVEVDGINSDISGGKPVLVAQKYQAT
jgi:hypothetical protein